MRRTSARDSSEDVARLAYHLRTPATRSGITPTRLAALVAVARHPGGLRQGDLAELMNISPPSMTRLVEIMGEAGWVARERDPDAELASLVQQLTDQMRAAAATPGRTSGSPMRTGSPGTSGAPHATTVASVGP